MTNTFRNAEVRILPPRLKSWRISIPKCRGSNPAAPTGQSVSNASHMKVAQKPRGTARFRRYELVSVCGIRQWRRHSCLLSQRAFFGVSFLLCALDAPRRAARHKYLESRTSRVDQPIR